MRHHMTSIALVLGLVVGTLGGVAVMYKLAPDRVTLYAPDWACTADVTTQRIECVRKAAGTL